MSEIKLVSPLLDGFAIGDAISAHHGVRCCPAMKENSNDKYIVKIISIPASQKQLDALLLTGAYRDASAAADYFKALADDTVKEARLLQQLAKLEGFLSYEGWQIVPMEGNDVGYDIYLLGSYKNSLEKHLRRNTMTHLGAVNLGIDLCTALSLCRRAGFIYTDLKPGNIFISSQREYRIGDLGFARLNAMKHTTLQANYISRYTAPELHDPLTTLNPTVDTYAVGMILYMIYNNGIIPFDTKAPMMVLPAPLNADYEMAEIILKACDPNPRKRYQTPVEMGKALVSYMQRNRVNDIPIVPPGIVNIQQPVKTNAAAEAAPPQTGSEAAAISVGESTVSNQPEELQFLDNLVADDTTPGSHAEDGFIPAQVSAEADHILTQADDLILHDPDILPEAIDLEEDAAPATETIGTEIEARERVREAEAAGTSLEAAAPAEESDSDEADAFATDFGFPAQEPMFETGESDLSAARESTPEEELDFDFDFPDTRPAEGDNAPDFELPKVDVHSLNAHDDDFFDDLKPRKKKRGWGGLLVFLLILALLGSGAYYYYDHYYLLTIDNMTIDGMKDSISVQLTTDADESLLYVICTDTYGNKQEKAVTDGSVSFTDLNADTMYKITVAADGFHKVTGSVSGSYTTAEVTRIVDFTAKSGMEDGSVILNFTVDGPESQEWTMQYAAEGEVPQSVSFNGHMVTINDLTVGKLYTFTLVADPSADLYLDGKVSMDYLASKIIVAEKLTIVSCVDGVLTTKWSIPDDADIESWTVRCYSENGFDETVTVTEPTAQFSNVSLGSAYTVEVTASGMTQSARAYVTANPATVTDVSIDHNAKNGIRISWNSAITPEGGWLVMYSIDGSETTEMAECSGTTATIKNAIPDASYSFQIMAADGSTVFGGTAEYAGFEGSAFNHHGLAASDIQSSLCHTPDKEGWTYKDVANSDYTTSYAPKEKVSLVLYATRLFYLKSDATTVMFVIRDAEGNVIPSLVRTMTAPWRDLWLGTGKYCYLDIPVMPAEFGEYTLDIYFNGATALTKNFTIISDIG